MAHTSCPSGHSMWNGDGKPVVYAFLINFFKDFVKKYPYFQLGNDEYLSQIYYQSNYYENAPIKGVKDADKDKFDINVHINQYACTWDDRTIQITEIIEKGKLYKGKDMDKPELPEDILKHEEIQSIFNHIRNTEGK